MLKLLCIFAAAVTLSCAIKCYQCSEPFDPCTDEMKECAVNITYCTNLTAFYGVFYSCGKEPINEEITTLCVPAPFDILPAIEIESVCYCSGDGCNTGKTDRTFEPSATTPAFLEQECNSGTSKILLSLMTIICISIFIAYSI